MEKNTFRDEQDATVSRQIETRGIDFQVTDEILINLKNIGAGRKTLQILKVFQAKNTGANPSANKIKVLVANFSDSDTQNDTITDTLIEELKEATANYPNVDILPLEKISPHQGKETALARGKEKNADIVIWGWYKKSDTNVLINVHFEIVSEISDIPKINNRKQIIENIQNFNSFAVQLNLSNEMSFLTLVSLGLINLEMEEFDVAIRCFTEAISRSTKSNEIISLSEVYLFRALAKSKKCNPVKNAEIDEDVNKAIGFGLDRNDPRVFWLVKEEDETKDFRARAEKYLSIAKTDKDKLYALFILTLAYRLNDDDAKAKNYATKLKEQAASLKESSSNHLYLAYSYLELDEKEKFISSINKAKSLAGTNRSLLNDIYQVEGSFYWVEENFDLAVDSMKKRAEINPGCYDPYFNLAEIYESNNRLDLAIINYSKAIELNPDDSLIYRSRAHTYLEKEDYEKALSDYRKAAEMDPSSATSYYNLGSVYLKKEFNDDAIANFSKSISLEDNYISSYSGRAEAYTNKKMYDAAMADYETAFKLGFSNKTSLDKWLLQNMLDPFKCYQEPITGYCSLVIKYSDKYIETYANESWGYTIRASIFQKEKNFALAIEYIDKALRLEPNRADYYERRASYFSGLKNPEKALSDYQKAIQLRFSDNSKDSKDGLRQSLGDLQYRAEFSGKNAELIVTYLDRYIQMYPQDGWGYWQKAELFDNANDVVSAIQNMNYAITRESKNASYYMNRGDLYLRKSDVGVSNTNVLTAGKRSKEDMQSQASRRSALADYETAFLLASANKDEEHVLQGLIDRFSVEFPKISLKYMNKYIQLFPGESWGFYKKAVFFEKNGELALAIDNISKAIANEPTNALYYKDRALLWIKNDSSDEALNRSLKDIGEAINKQSFYYYYYVQSEIYEKKKDIKSATESMEKAIKILTELNRKNPDNDINEYPLKTCEKRLKDLEKMK